MKCVIVLKELPSAGLLCNAAACIASGLFAEEDALGGVIEGKDCTFIPITRIPILITRQGKNSFAQLLQRAEKNKLKHMLFTHEAQSTTSYEEYQKRVEGKTLSEIEPIGIGVIGPDDAVKKFAGDLALFR